MATCAAWVEAQDGVASGFKVASAICFELGMEKWAAAKEKIKLVSASSPTRTPGFLQMETFYVVPSARGRGVTTVLIREVLAQFSKKGISFPGAEISLLDGNSAALKAYQKAGFSQAWKTPAPSEALSELMGSRGFVQLRISPSPPR